MKCILVKSGPADSQLLAALEQALPEVSFAFSPPGEAAAYAGPETRFQPLMLFPGAEYRALRTALPAGAAVGLPLCADRAQTCLLAGLLAESLPVPDRQAVVFLGHGSCVGTGYADLGAALQALSCRHCAVTREEAPDGLLFELHCMGIREVLLAPLLLTGGSRQSSQTLARWEKAAAGYGMTPLVRTAGIACLPAVQALILDRVRALCSEKGGQNDGIS